MKIQNCLIKALFYSCVGLASNLAAPESAISSEKFFCGTFNGAPSTMTKSSKTGQNIPIIMWRSSHFTSNGWSPIRRCNEVSRRFNSLHNKGQLKYLTTGRMNGLPVICGSSYEGGGCSGLLYTLKPGQNASTTLKNLLAIRTKATGPLSETSARLYIGIEEIESKAAEGDINSSELAVDSSADNSVHSTNTDLKFTDLKNETHW